MLAIDNIDIQNGRQEVSYMLPLQNGILQHYYIWALWHSGMCGSMYHTVVSFIFFRFLKSASQRHKNNGCSLPMDVHLVSFVYSLIPRPFPPPVFDRLQYANTEKEGLGDFVTCGYVRQTERRHMGGGARQGISKTFLLLSVRGLEARALARQCQYHLSFIAPGV